jgi:hypothetical protein
MLQHRHQRGHANFTVLWIFKTHNTDHPNVAIVHILTSAAMGTTRHRHSYHWYELVLMWLCKYDVSQDFYIFKRSLQGCTNTFLTLQISVVGENTAAISVLTWKAGQVT